VSFVLTKVESFRSLRKLSDTLNISDSDILPAKHSSSVEGAPSTPSSEKYFCFFFAAFASLRFHSGHASREIFRDFGAGSAALGRFVVR
jgi:hypothetical protein